LRDDDAGFVLMLLSSTKLSESAPPLELPSLLEPIKFRVGEAFRQHLNNRRLAAAHPRGCDITYMNGLFALVLPDVDATIRKAASAALRKARLPHDMSHLGLRSVKLNTVNIPGYEEYMDKHLSVVKDKEQMFAIGGDLLSPKEKRMKQAKEKAEKDLEARIFDPDSDYMLHQLLHPYDEGDLYTVFIALTSRKEYSGGEFIINKRDVDEMRSTFRLSNDGEELVQQMDHSMNEGDDDEDGSGPAKRPRTKYSEISRQVMEERSLAIVPSKHEHATRPVLVGNWSVLVLQYWAFQDSDIDSREPILSDGIPFPPTHDSEL
jgi:hypothetical protein